MLNSQKIIEIPKEMSNIAVRKTSFPNGNNTK